MQICADVLGLPISVIASEQTCALGSAIFAATASGIYPDVPEAMKNMASPVEKEFLPDPERVKLYATLYQRYLKLARELEN